MLTQLHIRDFAIIDAVEIEFGSGLTVLTGETGAGKSILVDALQLAIGARAGAEVIRHDAARAEVTATFELRGASEALRAELSEQSIEAEDELIVRRVITREGKSRAYLNGQPVPVQVLRAVGERLAEIHGQHEFQSLTRSSVQRELLDEYAGCGELTTAVAERHRERLARSAALTALESAARDRDARLDLLRHQVQELEALALQPGELATLTGERTRLAHSGRLADAARGALDRLYEADETNAHGEAARALQSLKQVASYDARIGELLPALEEAVIRLADTARELERYLDGLEADPARQAALEARLASVEQLARKHRVEAEQLPAQLVELRADRDRLETLEQDAVTLQQAVREATQAWRASAEQLSTVRAKAARKLSDDITARMQTLGMTGGRFEIALSAVTADGTGEPTRAAGLEEVEFRVSANAGQPPAAISKVASGGELSRLSLAVQVALAARALGAPKRQHARPSLMPCRIFDEVDSGVGGAVAEIVGRELASLGAEGQVLCVTHLPQVAALGAQHLRVSKLTDGTTTRTQITPLEGSSRVEEIARMLGGVTLTPAARAHASEMLAAGLAPTRERPSRDADSSPSGSVRKSRGRGR